MSKALQSSFSKGEISPALHGRVDIRQYQTGLKTARNTIVHQHGGISNRGGHKYIGPCLTHNAPPRLIPFQFKTTDTHIIELGHEYIRILRNDGHVTEPVKSISNITVANPGVVTIVGHSYNNNDEVFITGILGMTELNNQRFKVDNVTVDTFILKDQVTGINIDTSTFTAYVSGGTTARIFTLSTPYQQDDLRHIKYVQTADVITFVHHNYPVKELKRLALDNWTLTDVVFKPTVDFPTGLITSGGADGIDTYYQVTAIDADGQESLPGLSNTTTAITNITNSNPAIVTSANSFIGGETIYISGVVGMTEVNDRRFTVANPTATDFELLGEDSTLYTLYVSDGIRRNTYVFNTNLANVTVSWTAVSGAVRYRVFQKSQGIFGFIASTEATSYTNPGTITPDLSDTPPRLFEPFLLENNQPSAVGYHQQRMIFGGSDNEPDTTYASVIGDFHNFTHSIPYQEDDSFSMTLTSSQINDIRHYVSSAKDLLALTSGQEWVIQGTSGDARFSINTVEQVPQTTWGCSHVKPIVIDGTVLFVTASGHHVRSTSFSFEHDRYTAKDLTLLSPHIFQLSDIVEWDHVKDPDPIVYCVKADGELGVLTYNEDQEVVAWTHWDTDGKYESVAAIQPSIDEPHTQIYFVIKRKINGNTVRYIERTVERIFENLYDCFFVDCGLSLNNPITITNVATNNPVLITAQGHGFVDGDQVDIFDIEWVLVEDEIGNKTEPVDADGFKFLNGFRYFVANATANTFTLQSLDDGSDINGTGFPEYIEGGTVRKAVNTLSGLTHLKNTPVTILADGGVIDNLTVSDTGTLTLPRRFSRIHVGLPYVSDIETLNVEFAAGQGSPTIQGRKKKISFVNVKLDNSRGLFVGPDNTHLTEMKQREFEVMGEPTALFSGDKQITIPSNWNSNGRIFMRQLYPLPLSVLMVVPDILLDDLE